MQYIMLQMPYAPRIRIENSEKELEGILHIEHLLGNLQRFVENFGSAITLYEGSKLASNTDSHSENNFVSGWIFVAARDGAMSLYHFSKTLDALRASFKNTPLLKNHVNHEMLRETSKEFHKFFNEIDKTRHAVAHAAELTKSLEDVEKNAIRNYDSGGIKIENSKVIIGDILMDDNFRTMIEGHLRGYSVNAQSLFHINEILTKIYHCFSKCIYNPFNRNDPHALEFREFNFLTQSDH